MKLIHLALVAGVVIFGAVALAVARTRLTFELALQNPLIVIAALLTASNLAAAAALPRIFFRPGGAPADLEAAGRKYQTLCLVRSALLEGAALLAAVVMLLTGNVIAAGLYGLCALALVRFRPQLRELLKNFRTV